MNNMKTTVSFEAEFLIGEQVYNVTDMEQSVGLVVGYEFTNLCLQYICIFNSTTVVCNPIELTTEKTIF